jgi:hypothetical protein
MRLSRLIKRFELSAGRCVIVPGNHDLSWKTKVYDWQPEDEVVLNTLKPGSYVEQGEGYLIRDESAYPKRFENFGRFYHELIQLLYPLQPAAQCIPILFDDTRLQFLALNSAWEIDRYHRERASINQSAQAAGLLEADEQIARARRDGRMAQDADVLRIAVWHHEVWRDHSKIRVHTRCLRKDGGAWEGWAVWPGEHATERRTYYGIQLKG